MKYACVIAVTLRMKQAVHTYARIQSIWIEKAMVILSYTLLKCGFRKKAERKTRKKRSIWPRQIDRQREESGIYHTSVQEIALGDIESYFK